MTFLFLSIACIKEMTTVVAFDISLRSPAVVVFSSKGWSLGAFAQTKKDMQTVLSNETFRLTVFPVIDSSLSDLRRYKIIESSLVSKSLVPLLADHEDIQFVFEGYAFSPRKMGFTYKLHELTGIIKYSISTLYPTSKISSIPPSVWKRSVLGNTRASKVDVCNFVDKVDGVDMCTVFGHSQKRDRTGNKIVRSPVHDICDAMAIAMSV